MIIYFSHVIMVLLDVARGKPRHIPYRDSRLTFLLQVDNGSIPNSFCLSAVDAVFDIKKK